MALPLVCGLVLCSTATLASAGVFTETVTNVPIPDNSPVGVSSALVFPDHGVTDAIRVSIEIANSDVSGLTLSLTDPLGTVYQLYAGASAGVTLVQSYPDPDATLSGDLSLWSGANPMGTWTLKVVDGAFLNNGIDGEIVAWSVSSLTGIGDHVACSSAAPYAIPDNTPVGVADTIVFPSLGVVDDLFVSVDLSNSDITGLTVTLTDPDLVVHTLFAGGSSGTSLDTSWPAPTPLVSGDLAGWSGRDPAGAWTLRVIDTLFLNNGLDGQVNSWCVSNKVSMGNQTLCSTGVPVPIPDNTPIGVTDSIVLASLGLLDNLYVSVDLSNSDITGLTVTLTDPDLVVHTLFAGGTAGAGLDTTWPDPTPIVSGDLSSWAGRDPQGTWTLKVIDTLFLNNGLDGQIDGWCLANKVSIGPHVECSSGVPVLIPDNTPVGVTDSLVLPSLGLVDELYVSVNLSNSDITGLTVTLTDPDLVVHTLFAGGASGTELDSTWPDPTPLVAGDLSSWSGRDPQGTWTLRVIDTLFLNNGIDGQVNGWCVTNLPLLGETTVPSSSTPFGIPDNNPVGVADTIVFPTQGLAQHLAVSVDLVNSDISGLELRLTDPDGTVHVLYDQGSAGASLSDSYPFDSPLVSGDLSAWAGRNPAGNWTLRVIDTLFLNNGIDGQVLSWSLENLPEVGTWLDLGSPLAGATGLPLLEGNGTLLATDVVDLVLSNALPSTTAYLVLGIFALNAPFKGGVLVPDPTPPGFFIPLVTDGSGGIPLTGIWPLGIPPGFATYMQYWMVDGAAVHGFSASNGLSATAP
jgi:subtilisin-like proprotein convertase family protein